MKGTVRKSDPPGRRIRWHSARNRPGSRRCSITWKATTVSAQPSLSGKRCDRSANRFTPERSCRLFSQSTPTYWLAVARMSGLYCAVPHPRSTTRPLMTCRQLSKAMLLIFMASQLCEDRSMLFIHRVPVPSAFRGIATDDGIAAILPPGNHAADRHEAVLGDEDTRKDDRVERHAGVSSELNGAQDQALLVFGDHRAEIDFAVARVLPRLVVVAERVDLRACRDVAAVGDVDARGDSGDDAVGGDVHELTDVNHSRLCLLY